MDIHANGELFDRVNKHVRCAYIHEGLTSIVVNGVADITYKILAALSEEFGTKLIDVDCDTGTGSDPCHARTIIIRGRTK